MVTRLDPTGNKVEVKQKDIDYWCNQCQFPLVGGNQGCMDNEKAIQQCWNDFTTAGEWHKQHECPFIHRGLECRCNDFKTIKDAFKSLGIEYIVSW